MNIFFLHEQSALWASTTPFSGLRSGLALSKVQRTAPKPARKQSVLLQGLIHESLGFMNNAG